MPVAICGTREGFPDVTTGSFASEVKDPLRFLLRRLTEV
jgi:hypothetical protein